MERVLDPMTGHAHFGVTLMAYGQTGSGKTYTMMGPEECKRNPLSADGGIVPDAGICLRLCHSLFGRIERNREEKQIITTVTVGLLELYDAKMYDLLNKRAQLRLGQNRAGYFAMDQKMRLTASLREVAAVLVEGYSNVTMGATAMNEVTTRTARALANTRHCAFKHLGLTWSDSHCLGVTSLIPALVQRPYYHHHQSEHANRGQELSRQEACGQGGKRAGGRPRRQRTGVCYGWTSQDRGGGEEGHVERRHCHQQSALQSGYDGGGGVQAAPVPGEWPGPLRSAEGRESRSWYKAEGTGYPHQAPAR